MAAAHDMAAAVHAATGAPPTGFLVQRMAPPSVEMLVGVVNDPQFGPTIACGAGGALVEDHPHIAEMDCNPVMVSASGAVVVDARVKVAPVAPRRPLGARR